MAVLGGMMGVTAFGIGLTPVFLFVAVSSAMLAAFFTARNLAMLLDGELDAVLSARRLPAGSRRRCGSAST